MYTHPLFAGNIPPKRPSLYLHHTILVACMPMPLLQNTKTLFSRNRHSCGQGRQQTSKIHLVTDTSQLYHNCSGLNPCRRSLTLIQLWQTPSPGYSQLLLQIQALSTVLGNPLDPHPSLGLSSEPQTCPFSSFPVVSTLTQRHCKFLLLYFQSSLLQSPLILTLRLRTKNQSSSIFPSPFLPTTNLSPCPVKSCISGLLISLPTPSLSQIPYKDLSSHSQWTVD